MDALIFVICVFILFFLIKDIISLIIALCILSACFYILIGDNYTYIQNIFVSTEK